MIRAVLATLAVLALLLSGCADDPAPPPIVTTSTVEPLEETIPVDFSGSVGHYLCAGIGVGLCVPQFAVLSAGDRDFEQGFMATEIAFNLTSSWSSQSPSTASMSLRVYAEDADGERTQDEPLAEKVGSSPLELNLDWMELPTNSSQLFAVQTFTGAAPTPIILVATMDESISIQGEVRTRLMVEAENIEAVGEVVA